VLFGCLLFCASAFADPSSNTPNAPAAENKQGHQSALKSLVAPWQQDGPIGEDDWVLDRIYQESPANIVIELSSPSEEPVKVRLSRRNDNARNYCTTENFNLSDSSESSIEGRTSAGQRIALDTVCSKLAENDRGQMLLQAKSEQNSFDHEFMEWARSPWLFLGIFLLFFALFTWAAKQPDGIGGKCLQWGKQHGREVLITGFVLSLLVGCFGIFMGSGIHLNIEKYSGNETGLFGTYERQPPLFDLLFVLSGLIESAPLVTRFLGFLFWLVSAGVLYRLAKPYFGELRACLMALPLLFSDMIFTHGNPPDLVGMTLLLSLLSMGQFLAYQNAPSSKRLASLTLFNLLLVWTSHAGLVICAAQFFLLVAVPTTKKKGVMISTFISMIFSLLFFLGGLLSKNPVPASLQGAGLEIGTFLLLFLPAFPAFWPAIALAAIGIVRWRKSSEHHALFMLVCSWIFLGGILIELIDRAVGSTTLYLVMLLPVISMAMVIGAIGLPKEPRPSPMLHTLGSTLITSIVTFSFFVFCSAI